MEQEEGEGQYESERFEATQDNYNSMLLRLDPTPTLEIIRRFLLRQTTFNPQTQTWVRPEKLEPIFNEDGVGELMLELYGRMSVDKVLSKLDKNEINLIVREVGEVVMEFILFNDDRFGINQRDFNKIFFMIKHNIEIFLMRALGGVENILLSKTFSSREMVSKRGGDRERESEQQPQQKHSGFGWFGGGRG